MKPKPKTSFFFVPCNVVVYSYNGLCSDSERNNGAVRLTRKPKPLFGTNEWRFFFPSCCNVVQFFLSLSLFPPLFVVFLFFYFFLFVLFLQLELDQRGFPSTRGSIGFRFWLLKLIADQTIVTMREMVVVESEGVP